MCVRDGKLPTGTKVRARREYSGAFSNYFTERATGSRGMDRHARVDRWGTLGIVLGTCFQGDGFLDVGVVG